MNFVRIVAAAIVLLMLGEAFAAKTDIIVLANGNAVTGEIEELVFGSLKYGTDSMGTVQVDWEDIVSITSNQQLQVEVINGRRYFGNLESSDDRFHIKVITMTDTVLLATSEIVRMTPILTDERFVNRLEGDISFGFNTQKSSGVTTTNLSSTIAYRTRKYLVGMELNSSITDQPSEETKARDFLGLNWQRFRANRWFTDWYTSWERNDELGIALRTTAGGGLGRYVVQTNKNLFSLTGGLQAAREEFTGDEPDTTNAEGRIQIRYQHRNLDPEGSLSFTAKIFPLLEDLSQFRSETDISWKRDFFKDMYLEFVVYHSYTSDPPIGAEDIDYGITTSLGYDF